VKDLKLKRYLLIQAIIVICLVITPNKPALCSGGRVSIVHADGFAVETFPHYRILSVTEPYPGSPEPEKYVLLDRNAPLPEGMEERDVIRIPVKRCISTTTVNLAFLKELGVLETLIGQGGKKYVYDPSSFLQSLPEVGTGADIDLERIVELAPDVVFTYAYTRTDVDIVKRLRRMGVKVAVLSEYLEKSPLGRAEWIKFVSMFFCKIGEAEKLFEDISAKYEKLASLGRGFSVKPIVLPNIAYNGVWYIPGGSNWVARLFEDGGARYPWSEIHKAGNLPMDFEEILLKGRDADFWLHPGGCRNLDDILRIDDRYRLFKAFRTGMVYDHTKRSSPGGGNDYNQRGVLHPEEVLADIMNIFHPGSLKKRDLMYYEKLKP